MARPGLSCTPAASQQSWPPTKPWSASESRSRLSTPLLLRAVDIRAIQLRAMVLGRLCGLAAALGIAAFSTYAAQPAIQDWPVAGGAGQVRYSTLDQINTRNVQNLKKVWQWDSGDEFPGSEMQCNPIVIGGVVYATTPRVRVVALDATTGKMLWDFDAHHGEKVSGKQRNRGL